MTRELSDLIEETLLLQPDYNSLNTPAMERRGVLIRREIPLWLQDHLPMLRGAVPSVDDLSIRGRDATGRKGEIPWVRVYSTSLSPNAQTGWYVVYLFEAFGDRLYLTLCHGSTQNVGAEVGAPEFRPRSPEDIARLKDWANSRVGGAIAVMPRLDASISLSARRTNLGPAYEATTLCAFTYPVDEIPDDEELLIDMQSMLGLLDVLYRGEITDPAVPGRLSTEVADALDGVAEAAGRPSAARGGQGRGLSSVEKRAVELHAMHVAEEYLIAEGWVDIHDVSGNRPYDLVATRDNVGIKVEVKGTTSAGESVVLTRNEVKIHLEEYPNTALLVVHHIQLERGEPPHASGGTLTVLYPWTLNPDTLTPLGYEYPVPLASEVPQPPPDLGL